MYLNILIQNLKVIFRGRYIGQLMDRLHHCSQNDLISSNVGMKSRDKMS